MNGIPERSNSLEPAGPQLDGGAYGRRPRLPGSTLRGWFNEAELGRCPRCATNSLVTVAGGDSYCLECGHLPHDHETPPEPAA